MPANQIKHLLFLDDDRDFLDTIEALLPASHRNRWQVHLAQDTARALALLRKHPIDLVVCDLNMPVIDGLQFLQLLHQVCPGPRKVVLSGNTGEHFRQACLQHGAVLYLNKPTDVDGFGPVFRVLNEILEWQAPRGFSGLLRNVRLADLVQLECISQTSSVLQIATNTTCGFITICEGRVTHAEADALVGIEAFVRLVNLERGGFIVRPYQTPDQPTIDQSCESLLLEAAQRLDEETSMAGATEQLPLPLRSFARSERNARSTAEPDRPPGRFASSTHTAMISAAC